MAKTISSFPVDFDLYDDDHQQVLFITDDIAGQNLTLEITNTSDKPVSPLDLTGGEASASKHHFELVFRPGTVYNVQPSINLKSDLFELYMDKENGSIKPNEDGTLSLFFKSKGDWLLHEGEKLLIKIGQIRAEATDGTRGTRVMLKYRNLLHAGNQDAFSGFREMFLNIVNHRGKKNIPLHIGFVSPNKVLNDGKSRNTLKLRITNTSRKDLAIESAKNSKLVLSMESGPATQEWTMATDDQVKNTIIRYSSSVNPKKEETKGTLTWEIPFVPLEKGAFIDIEIDDLFTEHPTGQASVFLHYENIPGYWDGEIVLVAEKSPLVYKNNNVGIGTADARAKLVVVPPADGRGFEVLSPSAGNTHLPWLDNWNYISGKGVIFRDKDHVEKIRLDNTTDSISFGFNSIWPQENKKFLQFKANYNNDANRGQIHFYAPSNHGTNTPVMTLTGNAGAGGKVGIGTGDPSEMLEVKGNVKAEAFIGAGAFVRGMIVMWSGAIKDIPPTWALCDSQNGTPDLRNRFIVGVGQNYTPGATGGQDAVALTEHNLPAHAHSGATSGAGQHQHWIEGTDAKGLSDRHRTIPGTTTVDMGFGGGWDSDPNDKRWRGHVNTDSIGQHSHAFSTNTVGGNAAHENRPPYYALAFIMKL